MASASETTSDKPSSTRRGRVDPFAAMKALAKENDRPLPAEVLAKFGTGNESGTPDASSNIETSGTVIAFPQPASSAPPADSEQASAAHPPEPQATVPARVETAPPTPAPATTSQAAEEPAPVAPSSESAISSVATTPPAEALTAANPVQAEPAPVAPAAEIEPPVTSQTAPIETAVTSAPPQAEGESASVSETATEVAQDVMPKAPLRAIAAEVEPAPTSAPKTATPPKAAVKPAATPRAQIVTVQSPSRSREEFSIDVEEALRDHDDDELIESTSPTVLLPPKYLRIINQVNDIVSMMGFPRLNTSFIVRLALRVLISNINGKIKGHIIALKNEDGRRKAVKQAKALKGR